MIKGTTRRQLLVGAALIAASCGGAARAQTETPPAAPESEVDTISLEEIIVTAQKREENLQSVPISISALSSDALADQRVNSVVTIASQIPSLYIATPYGESIPIFSLRGISAVDYSLNQSSPVALYVDEVYKGLPVLTSLQVFDLDRAEVLRGPQGTLFGKNATGGAVSFYTVKPDVDDGFTGYLSAGYGRFDRREISGGANIPLIDGVLAGRAAFKIVKVDGFVKNRLPGKPDQSSIDDWAGRASLTFTPTDKLDMLLRYTRTRSSPIDSGYLAINIGFNDPAAGFVPGAGLGGVPGGYTRAGLGFFENEVNRLAELDIKNEGASLTINWDIFDAATLTSVTSYDEGTQFTEEDIDASPFDVFDADYFSRGRAFAQDLRIASSGDGPLKWLLGAYYNRDRVDVSSLFRLYYDVAFAGDGDGDGFSDGTCIGGANPALGPICGLGFGNELQQTRKSFALYTQNSYTFENGITLTAGLRYTKDSSRLDFFRAAGRVLNLATREEIPNAFVLIDSADPALAPAVDRLKYDNVGGKVGLSYELSRGSMVYANASRGYRGAAFNGAALFDPAEVTTVPSERLDSFEIGAKTLSFNNRLRINGAAFYYDYRNQQFIDTEGLLQPLRSAPKSRLWGGEVEITGQLAEPLTLRFNASYLNSEFLRDLPSGLPITGNTLLVAPKWTFSGGIDWNILEGELGRLTLHTDSRYTSRLFYDALNTERVSVRGYSVHDARLTFQRADKAFALSAWVKNVFNEKYLTYTLIQAAIHNQDVAHRGRAREYGVDATFRF